uniref:uncharacterized protein LOC120345955 isoform X3 n=1 Tax=Styela clava TaxID=7725 RepID=UPI0019398BA4|nr:uncharacterized protein LOC120345955 isoform X3 [Styela clava]
MMKSARKRFAKGKHVTSEPASMEHGDIVNITKRKIRPSSKVVENRKQEFDQQRQSVSKLCQKLVKLCETAKHVSHILRASSAMRASSRELMEMWSALEEMVSRKERTSLFRGIQQVDREVKDATRIAEETVDNLMEKRDESSSRSSTYRTSASSNVSRKSEKIALDSKQEWYDLQKDVGELEVKVKSVEEEKLLNLQALQLEYQRKMKILADESQLQMHKLMQQSQLELHLHKKELESKKARAQVCKKVQQVENPFGLNEEDFIANSSSQQSQILKSDWDHSLKTIHGEDNSNDIVCENINSGMNSQHANAFQHSPSGAYTTFVSPEVNMNSVSHLNNDLSACLRELAISNSMLANAYALPQIKVDIFDGNPLKFPAWESDFDALIEAKTTNVRQKLNLLSQHLSGDPKTMIQDLVLLQSDTAYAEAKEKLKSRYGNESVICKAFLDKLASWPRIRFRDAAGIQRYGDFLDQVKVAKHKIKDLEELQKQLDVKGVQTQLNLSTMMKSGALVSSQRIRGLQVMSMDRQVKIDIPQAYTREQVPASPSQIPKPEVAKQWKHLEKIADKLMPYDSKLKVSILIGSNIPSAVRPRDIIHGRENDPYGQKSILGWGIIGNVCKNGKRDDKSSISHRVEVTQDCSTAENLLESNGKSSFVFSTKVKEIVSPQQLNQMMEIDFVDHKSKHENMSIEDQRFVKILSENVIKCDNGMYEMPLPLKCDQVKLPNNKPMVLKRVMQLKKRFEKDSEYKSKYVEFMEDMIKNYAERVPENRLVVSDGKVNYVPHTAVFHSKKKTIRVVFDLSALYKGECINDHLLTGPDLMSGMTGILCRFRKEEIAVMGDIKGMFHQFVVREQDRDLLRFFWWNNGNTESELTEYRMTRHPFGARSSPGVAMYGLKLAGDDGEKAFGIEAADFVRDNFYVDDGLQSLETVNEAKLLIKNSTSLCAKAGLKLHKFVSNRREVLESIPECDRASSVKTIDLNNDPLPIERVLGMLWDVNDDVFRYHLQLKNQPRTRRGFLSIVSSIFDPMGFLSPVILEGKKILQELCKSKIDWDDPIPENVQPRVNAWIDDLHGIDYLTISRCIKPPNFGVVKVVEMHHFSDACQSGYGQCSYVRLVNENGDSHCTLLMGKSRVAPLKQISIPRMELTAATISARMSRYLREELRYENIKEYFWVDSMVVLGYVNNPVKRFHVFVANRIQQILDVSDVSTWLHVESNQNPSDLASRGISVKKLIADSKWWNGPEFLQCKGAYEPPEVSYVPNNKTDALLKHEMKKATAFITVEKENTVGYNFDIDRLDIFSSWFKAKRAVVNCIRFCHKLRKVDCANNLEVENLSISEKVIIRCLQQIHFSEEIEQLQSCAVSGAILDRAKIKIRNKLSRSSIYKLDPYIDEDGLIRVGGRIGRANMPMDCKHPLLLPRHSHVTNLIIRHFHMKVHHMGRGMTLNEIRQNGYWIVGGTSAVSQFITSCVACRRIRRPLEVQRMSDLPEDRVNEAALFDYSAVDVFGPFEIKERRSILKRYGIIFTCLSSRAVHLESANSLDTDSFLNALRRFLARRGTIKQLRADCGTNFIGGRNELLKAIGEIDQCKVREYLLSNECDWFEFKFNVPKCSHMHGSCERQIRTVRNALEPIMQKFGSQLDDESFRTVLVEAEHLVNSKPLTVSNLGDVGSPEPLTPNHLLTMKPKVLLPPPGQFQRPDVYARRRWRRVQYIVNQFWYRWRLEYLQTLQPRGKWTKTELNLCVGDIVIVNDENAPRNEWQLARVDALYPSEDGLIRKVRVLVADCNLDSRGKRTKAVTYLDRPIHKLVLLVRAAKDGDSPDEEPTS